MKNLIAFLVFTFTITSFQIGMAQDECGFVPDERYINILKNPNSIKNRRLQFMKNYNIKEILQYDKIEFTDEVFEFKKAKTKKADKDNIIRPIKNIPIVAHIIRRSDKSGGISSSTINDGIKEVNRIFGGFGMGFTLCETKYIDSDALAVDSEVTASSLRVRTRNVDGKINIYFCPNSRTSWAWRPNTNADQQHIVMKNSHTSNKVTFSHELGHFFDLLHTHGQGNTCGTAPLTAELVDGSNCTSTGDFVCDTSADPCVRGRLTGCTYSGTDRDANGDTYAPDPKNLMSYGWLCRDNFSRGQTIRMLSAYFAIEDERGYRLEPCTKPVVETVANKPTIDPGIVTKIPTDIIVLGPKLSPVSINGFYRCNDGGIYYIRQKGDEVFWFGEDSGGYWANVFKGKVTGNEIKGLFFDVPKGKAKGYGKLRLTSHNGGNEIRKVSGNFGGSVWTKAELPYDVPSSRSLAFYTEADNINDMTSIWNCDDGGFYYMRQVGKTIVWFGEGGNDRRGYPSFANVAYGKRIDNKITLDWLDVPKCKMNGSGSLVLKVDHANQISKVSGNGFGGSKWTRSPDNVRTNKPAPEMVVVKINLESLYLKNEDDGAGDEEELYGHFAVRGEKTVNSGGRPMDMGNQKLWMRTESDPVELAEHKYHMINKEWILIFLKEDVENGSAKIVISGRLKEDDTVGDDDLGSRSDHILVRDIGSRLIPESRLQTLGTFKHDETEAYFNYMIRID